MTSGAKDIFSTHDAAKICRVTPMTVIRWLLGAGMTYEEAGQRYAPFNRMAAPDPASRKAVADLARGALTAGRRFLCTINNNAEGCAPLSAVELAREIVGG